jgi:predicted ATPase
MAIKRIRISNFKSFERLDIELGKFNVLIGANASGKSNFIQIFKFLRDITNLGLDNAISMQGGIEYLVRIGSSRDFSLEVVFELEQRFLLTETREDLIGVKIYELSYKLAMKPEDKGQELGISEDKLIYKCEFIRLERQENTLEEKENLGLGEITISNDSGKIKVNLNPPELVPIKGDDFFPPFFKERELPAKTLLLETPFFFLPTLGWIFSDISIYDFDPKLPKKAASIGGKAELEEDGSNLALVLKNVIEDKEKKRKFSNLIKDLLPFVADVSIAKLADKSLLFKLRENYFENKYLPAFLLSDGTINITAMIIALYFEEKSLTIIEEPERNIHPYLISKVTDMMKDASQKKQVIVTTHNPEVVKYADLENIFLVSRNEEGFSTISKPSEREEIKIFLENEVGIDELYVQNML